MCQNENRSQPPTSHVYIVQPSLHWTLEGGGAHSLQEEEEEEEEEEGGANNRRSALAP